jgi:serine/threonine protein kinase
MTWCINPECKNPQNSETAEICLSCNCKTLLGERYRPIKIIGKGGFGRTFLAKDEHKPTKPYCVVKQLNFLSQDTEVLNKATELFQQEAVILEKLGKDHPQIPELLAYFKQDERLYIVQEFIQGVNLERSLHEQGVFSEERIIQLLRDILPVLGFVHKQKVYHRDIKPPNIIIRTSDNLPVLIDFGVAKVINNDESLLKRATALGTMHYAAPEQLKGKIFPASDLYSLGVTCIVLMTGINPISNMYDGSNLCWLWQKFLPSYAVVSEGLIKILDKLINYKPIERYQSAEEVLQALIPLKISISSNLVIVPDTEIIPAPPPKIIETPLTPDNETEQLPQAGRIYYFKLELLLEEKKWKEADLVTWKLLCTILGKPAETLIESNDINLITCECLRRIDELWIVKSSGHFGFSVQCQIFESVARDYVSFCQRVEWPSYDSISYHESLKFSDKAPAGHLPSRIWGGGDKFWRHLSVMTGKLAQCGITKN